MLRPYQQFALDSVLHFLQTKPGNPVIAMPTGTGKSFIVAALIREVLRWPGQRCLVLTHVKELIVQNMEKARALCPGADIGVLSSGLNAFDFDHAILFGGIGTVARRLDKIGAFDLVIIDECHLVNDSGETMYAQTLRTLKERNKRVRVIGLSATPYRMRGGMLTNGKIFTDIAVDMASSQAFLDLMAAGYLAPLVPCRTQKQFDVSQMRVQAGDYVQKELQEMLDTLDVNSAVVTEILKHSESRKSWLIFCTGINHAKHVAELLRDRGVTAHAIHSLLSSEEREQLLADFKAGKITALTNNNVLTTGFDAPQVDLIAMLRPTRSPGLWVQMLGRGTRPAEGKKNCLVLDFAGNTERLGPINDVAIPRRRSEAKIGERTEAPRARLCEACGIYSPLSAQWCEHCGADFPVTQNLERKASTRELISTGELTPEIKDVLSVAYALHSKEGKPDSVRVDYHVEFETISEYICLFHGGYATQRALRWWYDHSPLKFVPGTAREFMAATDILRKPTQIKVVKNGKWWEIVGRVFA